MVVGVVKRMIVVVKGENSSRKMAIRVENRLKSNLNM